jgi:hypothetical protein
MAVFVSCAKEEMIAVDPEFVLSFQRIGQENALAGTSFFVVPTGSGEFLTLYDGTKGKVWGEEGATGVDFNSADSLEITYKWAGTYNLTVVASSFGDFGKTMERKASTVTINTLDIRNGFARFVLTGKLEGAITSNDEILVTVPATTTDFNFKPEFRLESDSAKAYVNGVLQVSKKTLNDFSQPVVYTVKPVNGAERNFTVKVNKQ